MILHNMGCGYYAYQMAKWYVGLASRNMHSVEEINIGNIFDKARFHKLPFKKISYYTRSTLWLNLTEILGSPLPLRWFLPIPYFQRQDFITTNLDYIKFEKSALRSLSGVIYAVEKKSEDDLRRSGFKIKMGTQVPKWLLNQIGMESQDELHFEYLKENKIEQTNEEEQH